MFNENKIPLTPLLVRKAQMPKSITQVDYEALERIAKDFHQEAEEIEQILRRDLHGRRGIARPRRVAPEDRGGSFRRNDRVGGVFEHVDPVSRGNRDRTARR